MSEVEEEGLIKAAALRNLVPILQARARAEDALLQARDELEQKTNELLQLNNELEERVCARTAELNIAREGAENASKAKSAFLAMMGHEIRNPMNEVVGMIDVLRRTSLRSDQLEMVGLIRDSALSLLQVSDDIFDFSAIEARKLRVDQQPMVLADVIRGVCGPLELSAEEHNVRLTVFVDPMLPPSVTGDAARLGQVLMNVVENAFRFASGNKRSGEVALRVELAGQEEKHVTVEISVADNGVGLEAPIQARLFTPSSNSQGSASGGFDGSLELAISDQLVRLMGGTIAVRSTLNHGTTFTIRLRLAFATPSLMTASSASTTIF